jgi:hypothetical protein
MEPITIFSRIAAPKKVVERLRDLCPDVIVEGPDENWSRVEVPLLIDGEEATLTFTHSAEYYSEPGWSRQMDGMRGYFSRFPASENRSKVLSLTTTFCFSLGTLFEPDFEPSGDVRLDILFNIAEMLDGVLFTPSGLRDANGRILLSFDEDEHDPDAVWPQVLLSVSREEFMSQMERSDDEVAQEETLEQEESDPPTGERVARRAIALCAVTMRAMLEQDAMDPDAQETYRDMLRWLKSSGVEDELEPDEWEVVQRPLGKLDSQSHINATWRLEGLCMLAWALGKFEVPPHDQMVDVHELWRSLGLLDDPLTRELLERPGLRSMEEMRAMQERNFALHWRLRNYGLRPELMDFQEFASKCWFGPLSIEGVALVDGDLGLLGKRIDEATDDELALVSSIALERHLAINWLCDGPVVYSDADVST